MKTSIQLFATILILTCHYAFPYTLIAQDGSLDSTFGVNGVVYTYINTEFAGSSIVKQNDGKFVVAGNNQFTSGFVLLRYNANGTIDSTFGKDGRIWHSHGSSNSLAIQKDGKIISVGTDINDFAEAHIIIFRYDTNGIQDPTFGINGKVITSINGDNLYGQSLGIQNDGKIVITGLLSNNPYHFIGLVRYKTNGSLDSTFGKDGIVLFNMEFAFTTSLTIQDDNKILVAGTTFGLHSDFTLIRLNTNGALDKSFGINGIVITSIGNDRDGTESVVYLNDGKILVAGCTISPDTYNDFALVRYNSNGNLDSTFGINGKVYTDLSMSNDNAYSMTILSDDKIILSGNSYNSTYGISFISLLRYNKDGSLDSTFDNDGILLSTLVSNGKFLTIKQNDEKIVGLGTSSQGNIVLARFKNSITFVLSTKEVKHSEIKIYPNPLSTITTIHSDEILIDASLSINNIYGQEVKEINHISGHTFTFHRDNLQTGLYFILLKQDNKIISTNNKLVIID